MGIIKRTMFWANTFSYKKHKLTEIVPERPLKLKSLRPEAHGAVLFRKLYSTTQAQRCLCVRCKNEVSVHPDFSELARKAVCSFCCSKG